MIKRFHEPLMYQNSIVILPGLEYMARKWSFVRKWGSDCLPDWPILHYGLIQYIGWHKRSVLFNLDLK